MDRRALESRSELQEQLLTHANALFAYALPRIGDQATAEDLLQDTLVTAVSKLVDFQERSSIRTWLVGILRHKILDHYRWKKNHPGDQPGWEEEKSADSEPWFTSFGVWRWDPNQGLEVLDDDPGRAVERSQLRAVLRCCIERLPESLHRIFVLRELQELDPEETCEAAGISRDSLAVFLYRARQTLRACLQKNWAQP